MEMLISIIELYPDLLGTSSFIFYINDNKYIKVSIKENLDRKQFLDIMQTQLLKRSKVSKYHVIRQSENKIRKQLPPTLKANIFDDSESVIQYFSSPSASQSYPFSTKHKLKSDSSVFQHGEQVFITNNRKQEVTKIPTETVYKLNNYNTYRSNTIVDLQNHLNLNNLNKMPPIPKQKANLSSDRINFNKKPINFNRWDKKVDKFLYQQSIVSEAVYNADLRTRCGDQYFEQHLRDRHKEQMKPVPFVYSIKNDIEASQNKFIKLVQQIHPSLKIRNKLKIKGINRLRIKTEQDSEDYKLS